MASEASEAARGDGAAGAVDERASADGDVAAATKWLHQKLSAGGVDGLNTAVSQVLGTQSED